MLDEEFSDSERKGRKRTYSGSDDDESEDASSSEDDEEVRREIKKQHQLIREEKMQQRRIEKEKEKMDQTMGRSQQPRFMALKPGHKLEQGFRSSAVDAPKKLAKFVKFLLTPWCVITFI